MPLPIICIGVGTVLGWLNTRIPLLDEGSRHSLAWDCWPKPARTFTAIMVVTVLLSSLTLRWLMCR